MLDKTDRHHRVFEVPENRYLADLGDVTSPLRPPAGLNFSIAVLLWLAAGGAILPLASMLWFPEGRVTGCVSTPLPLRLGTEAVVDMAVSPGMACTLAAPVTSARLDDVVVTTPPAQGAVAARGRSGVVYRANPTFSGNDTFAFALSGRSDNGDGVMTVLVNVSVR